LRIADLLNRFALSYYYLNFHESEAFICKILKGKAIAEETWDHVIKYQHCERKNDFHQTGPKQKA